MKTRKYVPVYDVWNIVYDCLHTSITTGIACKYYKFEYKSSPKL